MCHRNSPHVCLAQLCPQNDLDTGNALSIILRFFTAYPENTL